MVGIELLTAARALQFVTRGGLAARRDGATGGLAAPLAEVLTRVGKFVDLTPGDRPLSDDVAALAAWVGRGRLPAVTEACLAPIAAR